MAKAKFFLDTRRKAQGTPCVLKVAIGHFNKTAYISLETRILPEQWDGVHSKVINHPEERLLNIYIAGVMQQVERTIFLLADSGKLLAMTANEIKLEVERRITPEKVAEMEAADKRKKLFEVQFLKFADSKKPSTRNVYMQTYNRLQAYLGNKLKKLAFEDITKEWLTAFENFLAETAPSKNARNIHLRNIRAVFNEAIDNEITSFYPFRRFKIRSVATVKRNLKVEELRTLFDFPAEEHARKYIDIFKLQFMLIGINTVDLCNLKEVEDGRITFYRAKTNRLYSIKVEPEAMEIINRYRGENRLLYMLDRCPDHNEFTRKINEALKKVGPVKRVGLGGKKIYSPLFPKISTYWARHSWATIAASLDIPKDTIAHALGHGNNTVTDIYIEFDQRKVDAANRMVLDWVLYGKKTRRRV